MDNLNRQDHYSDMNGQRFMVEQRPLWRRVLRWGMILLVVASISVSIFYRVARLQPPSFKIEAQASVDAPPSQVYEVLNDVQHAHLWLPWDVQSPGVVKQDPLPTYEWQVGERRGSVTHVQGEFKDGQGEILLMQFHRHNQLFWHVVKIEVLPHPEHGGSLVKVTMAGTRNWWSRFTAHFLDQSRTPLLRLNQRLENLPLPESSPKAAAS